MSGMIERALDRWRTHVRLLVVLVMCWAGASLFFAAMAVVFAVSGRPSTEKLAPWWIVMAVIGFVVATLGELARRAVQDRTCQHTT